MRAAYATVGLKIRNNHPLRADLLFVDGGQALRDIWDI